MNGNDYSDIIDLEPPVSAKHPPMPLHDRAAQFAPFAALTGFDAAISETARLTDRKIEPDDETMDILNAQIHQIRERLEEKPEITVTYFVPDARKSGGKYVTHTACVRRIDDVGGQLVFTDGTKIDFDAILRIDLRHNPLRRG